MRVLVNHGSCGLGLSIGFSNCIVACLRNDGGEGNLPRFWFERHCSCGFVDFNECRKPYNSRVQEGNGICKPETMSGWQFTTLQDSSGSRPLHACADNSLLLAWRLGEKMEVVLRILWWSIRRPLILDFSRPSRRPRLCAEPRSRSRHVAIHPVAVSAPHLFLHHISSYCKG